MAINKVEINGEVKLDLTQDTVSEDTLLQGTTAHDAAGHPVEGKVVTTPIPVTEDVLKGDGRGGIDTMQTSPVESIDIPVGIFKGTASGSIETAIPGTDYLAQAPVTSVNGKTGDVVVEGTQILVDGILEGDGAGNISAAQTLQAETADAQVLPTVTTSDNGKFLRVVSGQWQAVVIRDANGQSF